MKNIGFHIVAIALLAILILTAGDAAHDLLEEKGKITTLSALSAFVAMVGGYFALGAGLAELHKRFKSGTIHDFLYTLLKYYFPLHKPIKSFTQADLDRFFETKFKHAIKNYCNKRLNVDRYVQIKEIIDIPFDHSEYSEKEFYLHDILENLIQTICNFHLPPDDRDTFNTSFIIGKAGSGKSFAIKRVALALLEKVKSNEGKIIVPLPIPVSNWQGTSMEGWVISTAHNLFFSEENKIFSRGNKETIAEFLKNQKDKYEIIYLFDGLDEIKNEHIEGFFTAVKGFLGTKSIIFSTRKEVFDQFLKRELLSYFHLFKFKDLSKDQIQFVIEENIKNKHKKQIIDNNEVYENFSTPLLLGVLAKVVNDGGDSLDSEMLKGKNILSYIWGKFIEIVFEEKSRDGKDRFSFSLDQLLIYAHFMAKREEDGFNLDDLQPKVLIDISSTWFYAIFTRLLIGIVISMGIGFTMSGPLDFIPAGLLGGLISGIAFLLPTENWIFSDPNQKVYSIMAGIKIILCSLVYLFLSLVVFGVFFSISGQRRDMIELIAPADWIIGILFAVMFTILTGVHDLQHNFKGDIQLIQKRSIFHYKALDFPKALSFTLAFGVIVAMVCSGLAVLYSRYFPTNIFTGWMKETSLDWGMTIFIMVFCIVLPIASSIGFIVGLNNPNSYKVDEEQQKDLLPYFSITNTIYNSIILSFVVMLVFAGAWSLFNMLFFQTGWEGGNKGIESGFAAAIFIGIWWGWKDIIKTWVLRLTLSLKGEASISFPKMIKDFEKLGIIIRTGARYEFRDRSLDKYLEKREDLDAFSYPRIKWILPPLIIAIFLIVLVRITWKEKFYWNAPITGLELTNYTKAAKKISTNQVKVLKSGKLIIQSRGLVRVGRILGHVTPVGTSTGFFGMPLKTTFNILPEGKHGALMYRLGAQGSWRTVYNNPQVQFMDTYRFLKTHKSTLLVKKNDTLEFAINDTEWQNNFKDFHIRIYSSTRKKKSKK